MSQSRCPECGAELLYEARFCRQCGIPVSISNELDKSEMPTAVLGDRIAHHDTQRLASRLTSPGRRPFSAAEKAETIEASRPRRRWVPATVIFGIVLLAVIGIVSAVAFVRMKHNSTTESAALIYPGAKTVTDMSNERGGRALHLQTNDSLERVADWYEETLKPSKVMRLTPSNVVMKNEVVTATIAADGGTVNILIKVVEK